LLTATDAEETNEDFDISCKDEGLLMRPFCISDSEVPVTEPSSRRSGYARLLDRAIRILAMRDHSEQELRRKLSLR
jgi:hypothetical protein